MTTQRTAVEQTGGGGGETLLEPTEPLLIQLLAMNSNHLSLENAESH